MLAVFVVSKRIGWLVVEGWVWQTLPLGVLLGRLWVSLLNNTGVAFGEEIVFRAYLLTGLKEAWGRWAGLAIMMVVFGVVHFPAYIAQGMHPLVLGVAIALAAVLGAVFGLIYLRTGSLWIPVGMHFAWNFVECDLLNLIGDSTNQNLVGAMTQLQGPISPAGAGYGSTIVLDMMAFIVLCVGLWLWMSKRQR
jgi:membrane protease YdiL (CAAX protease family)